MVCGLGSSDDVHALVSVVVLISLFTPLVMAIYLSCVTVAEIVDSLDEDDDEDEESGGQGKDATTQRIGTGKGGKQQQDTAAVFGVGQETAPLKISPNAVRVAQEVTPGAVVALEAMNVGQLRTQAVEAGVSAEKINEARCATPIPSARARTGKSSAARCRAVPTRPSMLLLLTLGSMRRRCSDGETPKRSLIDLIVAHKSQIQMIGTGNP